MNFASLKLGPRLYGVDCTLSVRRLGIRVVDNLLRVIGPLHDPVTWHGINCTGTQITQWDFQNKGKSGWTGTSSFVLEVPLRNLRPSVIYSVPCDLIVQRAYYISFNVSRFSADPFITSTLRVDQ